MDDNNITIRDDLEKKENAEPVSARDVWHEKTGTGSSGQSRHYYGPASPGKKSAVKRKPVLIFGCIVVGIMLLAAVSSFLFEGGIGRYDRDISGASDINEDHIGVLYIEGEIGSGGDTYNHQYVLDAVDGMMYNDDNKGLMLFVNTPGGGVYESDELYLKIKDYQENTGRPVYAYFASQATSGGYYISASADKIVANRNCWTGSIGVTIGTLYDISGLLEKYGIETETITSGRNKAMGDITAPMTDEQKKIFRNLVDEAYEQFVSIVADGRDLDISYVKTIADGRIYTAKQAKKNKLIDDVVETYDDAIADMKAECSLRDCEIYAFRYVPESGLLDELIRSIDNAAEALSGDSDISAIAELMKNDDEIPIQYMCKEIK